MIVARRGLAAGCLRGAARALLAIVLVAAGWRSSPAQPGGGTTDGPWEGTTGEGAAYRITVEDAGTALSITLRDLPSHDRHDMIVLALPWWGEGAAPQRASFVRAVIDDAERGGELVLDPAGAPRDVSRRLGLTSSLEAWFSLKGAGFAGDLPVAALTWSMGGLNRSVHVREVVLRLPLAAPPPAHHVADLRPLARPARERLEALVANPSWIDRCRVARPPMATIPGAAWAFHDALDEADRGAATTDGGDPLARWRVATLGTDRALRITRRDLEAAGWRGPAADPRRVRLFRDGAEVPTLLLGDASIAAWIAPSALPTARDTTVWIEADASVPPRRMEPAAAAAATPDDALRPSATIRRRTVVGDDRHLAITRDQFLTIIDFAWVDRDLPPGEEVPVDFDLPYFAPGGGADARLETWLFLSNAGGDVSGSLLVRLDGERGRREAFHGRGSASVTSTLPAASLAATANRLILSDTVAARREPVRLDRLEIVHDAEPYVDRVPFVFELERDPQGQARVVALAGLATGDSPTLVFDVTDEASPRRVETTTDPATLDVRVGPLPAAGGRFVALTELELAPPPPLRAPPIDLALRRPGAVVDQWIIHHADFRAGAERLAAHRRAEGWAIGLADIAAIEAAFGTGHTDPDALRRFLAHQLAHAARVPASALLVGDATHDWRDDLRTGVRNFIPAYREGDRPGDAAQYPVDLHYGRLVGDDWLVDLAVGRLSVASADDLDAIVDKIIAYDATPALGPWRARSAQVADTGGFIGDADSVRHDDLTAAWSDVGLYLDRFAWIDNFLFTAEERRARRSKISPAATTAIRDAWNDGLAFLLYWGHGSPNIWSNQRMWFGGDSPNSDNLLLENAPRLPFVANMTCNTGAIDYPLPPWNVCMTEDIMRRRGGGAIAVYAPGGMGIPAHHRRMATALVRALTRSPLERLGDLVTAARWEFALHDIHDGSLRMYGFQGDPLARLQRPRHRMDVTAQGGRYAAADGATVTLRGSWPSALRDDATRWWARVVGPAGDVAWEAEGRVGAGGGGADDVPREAGSLRRVRRDGAWELTIPPLAAAAGRHTATVYAWNDAAGEDAHGGVSWMAGAPRLVVRDLQPRLVEVETGRPARFEVTVENVGAVEARAAPVALHAEPLAARRADAERAAAADLAIGLVNIPAGERRVVTLELTPPSEVAAVRARALRHADPSSDGRRLTAAVWRRGARSGLYPVPSSATWTELPAGARPRLAAALEALLLPGPDAPPTWRARLVDGRDPSSPSSPNGAAGDAPAAVGGATPDRASSTLAGTLEFGVRTEPALLRLDVAAPADGRTPLLLRTEAIDAAGRLAEDVPALDLAWSPALLPDLALVALEGPAVAPIEGETAILVAEVENRGAAPLADVVLRAWLEPTQDAAGAATELSDRTSPDRETLARLAPGERRRLTLRWDPDPGTPRDVTLRVRATTAARQVEANDDDNERLLPLRFRANFELRIASTPAVRVEMIDPAARRVRLHATIANDGEAPADRVEVNFYATRDDAAARRDPVATTDLASIAPGGAVDAVAEWIVPREIARAGIAPVVVVNIKGSRQRVSGEAGEGTAAGASPAGDR